MSLRESELVAAQTVLSNGAGASVGLEAGYAQIGAGIASTSRRDVAFAPAGFAHAGRLRRRRRHRGGVRRAADRRLLRLRAHHRRLFARQCRAGLRRDAGCGADHQGHHRGALCDQRAGGLAAEFGSLRGSGRARAGGGGARRGRDARGRADRARLPHPRTLADISPRRRRNDARRHGALHASGARRRPWRAGARFLLAADRDGAHRPHRTEAHRESGVAGLRLPRRLVLRLAVRRLAPRQALFDRHRLSIPVSRPRHDRLRARRHGDPEHCDRRRAR